ncbi:hypothetical protein [Cupriavidus sp. amp6]|uniref:hypothetical protein n=1 Tax=Cupriavidus sp. amp6 TaxID=388051 RepID=UPI000428CEF5|nr:hypothetical protein [Cupriavidus sp. amp6]
MSEQSAEASATTTAYLLKLATVYGVALAGLYLLAYWGAFNINILPYMSLTDIFKVTAYPLVVSLGSLIIGALVGEALHPQEMFPEGGGKDTPVGKFLNRFKALLGVLYYASIVLIAYFGRTPLKWVVVGMLCGIAAAQFTAETPALRRLFPSRRARTFMVTMMVALLGAAFGHGQLHAERAKEGNGPMKVDGKRSNLPLQESPEKPAVLLGFVGDRYFIYERATGSVIVVKQQDEAPVVLAEIPPEPATSKSQSTSSPHGNTPATGASGSSAQPSPKPAL